MRKYLFIILLLATEAKSQELNSKIHKYISKNTYRIAAILKVPIRVNIVRDSLLKIKVYQEMVGMNAGFSIEPKAEPHADPKDTCRYYSTAEIGISPLVYKVAVKQIDTTKLIYYKSLSTIVHEYTHYIHATPFLHPNYVPQSIDSLEMNRHISQNPEFDAWSVGAYFLLEVLDKKKLKHIMKMDLDIMSKRQLLINAYYKIIYPWRKFKIFPISE